MRNLLLLVVFILIATQSYAIDINRKFGKVSKEELLMDVYEKDSSAEAVILFDIGKTLFNYDTEKGFVMVYERQVRIKIFNKDGFDYANFSIPLYHASENSEKILKVKAVSYNLVNDKIIKTKLKNSDFYNIEDTQNKTIRKFSLPSVKEGSVIEVNYTIRSDFFYNLQEWKFQHFIPVLWSEYSVEIPEYFNYNKITKGYLPFSINESTVKNDFITITTKNRTGEGHQITKTEFSTQKNDFQKQVIRLAVKDAPAMKREAFMLSADNYISSIEFELAHIKFPQSKLKNYSKSWESINKELLDHPDFGDQLKNGNYLSDIVEEVKRKTINSEEQIQMLYKFMIENFKWNERNALYTSQNLRKTLKEKSGNSADLNLLMINLLREAGFNADPVILSTRNHGLLNLVHPSVSQMNYVVALLNFEGEQILIDATDPYCSLGMLPPKCINDRGRIVNEQKSDWINIESSEKYTTIFFGKFEITDQGIKGSLSSKRAGLAAYNFRHAFKSFNTEQDYIVEMESKNLGLKVDEYQFENMDSIGKPVQEKYINLIIESIENLADMIYFNPITIDKIEENPFKLESRNYPIDYNYLYKQKYIFNYTIPEGYIVEELPKSEQISLPEEAMKYQYFISHTGNDIQITIIFDINKRQFLPNEYEFLKDFYNRIIAKEKEQIVLKKS